MKHEADWTDASTAAAGAGGPPVTGPAPSVSIVTATYNRPEVLGFAIRSILHQDFRDWELIVVGDLCSAATAELVASFSDQRIRYVNLALNYGEQSGPNNVGIARARGRYIAFLNHDDCWFPDHLRAATDWLQASGADAVLARSATVVPSPGPGEGWSTYLTGQGRNGRYDPVRTEGPASSLLLKSEVARAAGPWRSASDCFSSSSQEWLYRIWLRGFAISTMPHLTVVQFPSGLRPKSYVGADASEHAHFEPQFERPLQLRLALLDRNRAPPRRPVWRRLARSVAEIGLRAAARLGLPPSELIARFYLGFGRGTFIDSLRDMRGLGALPNRDPSVAELRARYALEQPDGKAGLPHDAGFSAGRGGEGGLRGARPRA
jgi:glycosyltransferase involved in cell wall biosynthesis